MDCLDRKVPFLAVVLVLFAVSGCATVFTGQTTSVALNTPDGKTADAQIQSASGVQNVSIPTVITVERSKEPIQVQIQDDRCDETSVTVPRKVNLAFYANFLFGLFGTTSAGVDASNGAMWTYDESIVVPVNRLDEVNK